jgi:hypothetical protein
MIKSNLIALSLIASIALIGCGSDDNPAVKKDTKTNISGSVVDGPIYDANVSIYDMSGNFLGSTTTSRVDGKLGDYNLSIDNLPEEYRIKVTGGKDAGIDAKINDNDIDNKVTLKSIGTKDNNETFVSPATTLISNMVEHQGLSVKGAKEKASEQLGMKATDDLTLMNPKTNKKAAKAGTLVAQVVNSLPIDNQDEAMKAFAKHFKDNKIATIGTSDVNITDTELLSDIITIFNEDQTDDSKDISEDEIKKIKKTQTLSLNKINNLSTKTIAFDNALNQDMKLAIADFKAADALFSAIENKEYIDFDSEDELKFLEQAANQFETALKDINMSNVDENNLNTMFETLHYQVEEKKDINLSTISQSFEKMAKKTFGKDKETLELQKEIFKILPIDDFDDIVDINDTVFKTLAENKSDSEDNRSQFFEIIAGKFVNSIENNDTFDKNYYEKIDNQIIDLNKWMAPQDDKNVDKNETAKKAEELAQKEVLKTIAKQYKENKDFTFDTNTSKRFDDIKENTEKQILKILPIDNDKSSENNSTFDLDKQLKLISIINDKIDTSKDINDSVYSDMLDNVNIIYETVKKQDTNNSIDEMQTIKNMMEKVKDSNKTTSDGQIDLGSWMADQNMTNAKKYREDNNITAGEDINFDKNFTVPTKEINLVDWVAPQTKDEIKKEFTTEYLVGKTIYEVYYDNEGKSIIELQINQNKQFDGKEYDKSGDINFSGTYSITKEDGSVILSTTYVDNTGGTNSVGTQKERTINDKMRLVDTKDNHWVFQQIVPKDWSYGAATYFMFENKEDAEGFTLQ